MAERNSVTVTTLVVTLLAFGLISIPLAGLSWDMLSDLIAGHLAAAKAAYGVPALLVLFIVLRFAARALVRLDARFGTTAHPGESAPGADPNSTSHT